LLISDEALEQLRAQPKDLRRQIGERLSVLESGFASDIKKLVGRKNK